MHTQDESLLTALRIERSGVPLYIQIRDQVVHALNAGVLAPGARMPTMRQMAVALKVDLNTVRHAYEELERLGAITLVHGSGSYVREREKAPAPAQFAEAARIDALARETLAAAAARELDPVAVAHRIIHLSHRKDPP